MPHMEPTEVMMLGRLGQAPNPPYGPAWRTTFLNPPMTTPQQPQNLLRQTVMNGCRQMLGQLNAFDVVTPGQFPGSHGIPRVGFPSVEEGMRYAMGNGGCRDCVGAAGQRFVFGQTNANGNGNGLEAGVSAWLPGAEASTGVNVGWGLLSTASMAASAWHGYRRHRRVGWSLWWGFMGAVFPIITPAIGAAQGWGKRKGR